MRLATVLECIVLPRWSRTSLRGVHASCIELVSVCFHTQRMPDAAPSTKAAFLDGRSARYIFVSLKLAYVGGFFKSSYVEEVQIDIEVASLAIGFCSC
jgi:hypothetical protein